MIDSFKEILTDLFNVKTKNSIPVRQVLAHMRAVKRLRKRLPSICKNKAFTQNEIRYITENFPRLEEYMYDDAVNLTKIGKIRTVKGYSAYYLAFLQFFCRNLYNFEKDAIFMLLKEANSLLPYPSLSDSSHFIMYIRCALCSEICRYYLDKENKKVHNSEKILVLLFSMLDTLKDFDENDSIALNPAEIEMEKDSIYVNCTDRTKESFRRNLAKLAAKNKTAELEFAKHLSSKTDNFTSLLCDKPFGGQMYIILHIFLTLLFTVFLCVLSPIFILAAAPVYRCVKLLLDRVFAKFVIKHYTEPALKLQKVPKGKGVLVTITSLLTNDKSDGELFDRLENMYFSNGGENIYFSILCDLCDSSERQTGQDDERINFAVKRTLELRRKYGDIFFLFVRERQYSTSEECYIAPERKRGAVNSLCAFMCGKSDVFSERSIKPDSKICDGIKYIFTLDADTNLAFDCVKKAVGIMLHPRNTPVFDSNKGRVVKGYGILQPVMMPSVTAATKTFFTSVMCGAGGIDSYSSAEYELTQALFDKGVFCGKGMFDKECFYNTLCKNYSFENQRVLSHDAPEGALLRCLSTSNITLTDGFPKEQMSYNKRRHRWIRGDVQNLAFMGKKRKNQYGRMIKNGVDLISKYLILENVWDALLPIFSLILVFFSVGTPREISTMLVTVAVAPYIIPFAKSVTHGFLKRVLFSGLSRVFYSKGVLSGIWSEFFRMFYSLSSIAQNAYVCADGVIRGLCRGFVTGKNTLQWTTAAQSDAESADGLLGYVRKNLFSAFCGTAVVVMSPNAFVRLVGLLWLALPVTAYKWGKPEKRRIYEISEFEKSMFMDNMKDMWSFFEDTVSKETNYLPCDNVSFCPKEKTSYMTSPTNIGLYMVSACVAMKSGLVDLGSFKKICDNTLGTLMTMEKYKGLLYNWYDVRNLDVLEPKFVSSVDVGNYAACLYTVMSLVKEYAKEYRDFEKNVQMLQTLIDEIDYGLLFNSKRKLFYIGFTVKDGRAIYERNCYDMLMSETRILSYVALSHRKVDTEHDLHLARTVIESERFSGLASWSGTVFEYFMPAIFIPVVQGSLSYEALSFAFAMNVKSSEKYGKFPVFGISESCFNSYDDSGNYAYHAFGNEKLALCVFNEERVISPYSSYLMLEMSPEKVMSNLEKLRSLGMYGKYGFYESCDFERHGPNEECATVQCFMSHHVGMSICSLANFLFDGYVRRSFMNDGANKSASEFYEQRIGIDVYTKKRARKYYPYLSKALMRPVMGENEKKNENEKSKEKVRFPVTERKTLMQLVKEDENIKISLCFENGADIFGNLDAKYERCGIFYGSGTFDGNEYNINLFRDKRGINVITVSCMSRKGLIMTIHLKKKAFVNTECEGVVFDFEDKKAVAMGFVRDEYGCTRQAICKSNVNEEYGILSFDDFGEETIKREYVLAWAYAKSFDGVHRIRKKLVENLDEMKRETQEYYKNLAFGSKESDKNYKSIVSNFFEKYSIEGKYVLPLLFTQKSDIKGCAESFFCLVNTNCCLKKYALHRLCVSLAEKEDCSTYEKLMICGGFAAYCSTLCVSELKEYLELQRISFRLVMKTVMEIAEDNCLSQQEKKVFDYAVQMLETLCARAGDEAAEEILGGIKLKE